MSDPYRTPGDIDHRPRTPGGTSGGTKQFLIGLAMLIAGGYWFLDNVVVMSRFSDLFGWGHGTFGLSLVPFFIGVVALFYNGKSIIGWILMGGGLIIIVAGVIARLTVYYKPRSLFDTLLVFVLIAGGVGLIARSLREQ